MPQLNPEFFVSQLFWLVVTFSFLLVFLWRISLPRIGSVLEKREKKINDDIATTKELHKEAESIQKIIEDKLRNARTETAVIIKTTSIDLQKKTASELVKLDKDLDKKIETAMKKENMYKPVEFPPPQKTVEELDAEIDFFKKTKPKFVSKLIYYNEIYKIETRKPYGGERVLRKYLQKQLSYPFD